MRPLHRLCVVVVCYVLSAYGLFFSLLALVLSAVKPDTSGALGVSIGLAWLGHLMLSLHWVVGRRSGVWLLASITVAAVVSLLWWPLATSRAVPMGPGDLAYNAAVALALNGPCALLAAYLLWWHSRPPHLPSPPDGAGARAAQDQPAAGA